MAQEHSEQEYPHKYNLKVKDEVHRFLTIIAEISGESKPEIINKALNLLCDHIINSIDNRQNAILDHSTNTIHPVPALYNETVARAIKEDMTSK